jgi:hypothetical protein
MEKWWEPRMEKGCILPHELVQELRKEDNMVLYSVARFCSCTTKELINVLEYRNKHAKYLSFWYRKFAKKVGKKTRILRAPIKELEKIQKILKERFSQIPTSLAAMGGKIGDSVEKNTEIHRYNPYLLALDIKNAYPSIDTHRVYKNLQWTLGKALKIWAPHLKTKESKDLFIKVITHLCVCEDELPQW